MEFEVPAPVLILTFDEVQIVFEFLREWLLRHAEEEELVLKQKYQEIARLDKVLSWLFVMLDSHFTELVLLPQFRSMLTDLKTITDQQVKYCEKFEKFMEFVGHVLEKKSIVQKGSLPYAVEVLRI